MSLLLVSRKNAIEESKSVESNSGSLFEVDRFRLKVFSKKKHSSLFLPTRGISSSLHE